MNEVPNVPVARSRSVSSLLDRPLGEPLSWLRTEIDRLFNDFGHPARSIFDFGGKAFAPVPALDLIDDDKSYRLTAELPGLTEKDIIVSVSDGALRISGEKKAEEEHKENGYLLSERRYGAFERQIPIPADVQSDTIKAQFKDGVLTVTLAKDAKSPARARKIAIEKA
ncbi:MAG: Hsp20/alpha crystallin family protein [Sphingomonadales bacterium]|nr:Hsp20/alpha crystallin family protein [Sphingomonadales bacterium]MDE2169869.1 Hsp20/alpha crystallin family protein [Sphingomonadales bacterium]